MHSFASSFAPIVWLVKQLNLYNYIIRVELYHGTSVKYAYPQLLCMACLYNDCWLKGEIIGIFPARIAADALGFFFSNHVRLIRLVFDASKTEATFKHTVKPLI